MSAVSSAGGVASPRRRTSSAAAFATFHKATAAAALEMRFTLDHQLSHELAPTALHLMGEVVLEFDRQLSTRSTISLDDNFEPAVDAEAQLSVDSSDLSTPGGNCHPALLFQSQSSTK